MSSPRLVDGSPKWQGEDERVSYAFKWSALGIPTSPVVVIKNSDMVDVSSTCLSGSPYVVGGYVVTPLVIALTAGKTYYLECQATLTGGIFGSNTLEAYLVIIAEE